MRTGVCLLALFAAFLAGVLFRAPSERASPQTSLEGGAELAPDTGRDTSKSVASVVQGVRPGGSTPEKKVEQATVLSVVDGDTIEVRREDGTTERVRYIGIDTPETVHPQKPVQCFGKEASAKNRELVNDKEVVLERDITDRDKYGRLLRYVYVGDTFVNEVLVQNGFAHAYPYPPDVRYEERFRAAERSARQEHRGLWGGVCDAYVSVPVSVPDISAPSGCAIKGNVSASGEKIFHVPGCKSYEKTVINEEADERWFCSEAEARAAGWRKALNC